MTSRQPMLPGLDSDTFSAASPAGASPSALPESLTTPPSGPARAPASLSRWQDFSAVTRTIDTSGPSGTDSSPSAGLQSSLASRLVARLEGRGSPLYALTWKTLAMPSGPPILQRRASALRTSGNASSSAPSAVSAWPTPTRQDGSSSGASGYSTESGRHSGTTLTDAARQVASGWPTARAADGRNGVCRETHEYNGGPDLPTVAGWATAKRSDGERGGQAEHLDGRRSNLLDQAMTVTGWGSPSATEPGGTPEQALARKRKATAQGSTLGESVTLLAHQVATVDPGKTPSSSPATTPSEGSSTARRHQLAAAFSLWLQGYPATWRSCAPAAMRSAPKPRRPSSPRSSKRSPR